MYTEISKGLVDSRLVLMVVAALNSLWRMLNSLWRIYKNFRLVRFFSREKFIISFSRNPENFLRCINIGPNSVVGIQKFEVI